MSDLIGIVLLFSGIGLLAYLGGLKHKARRAMSWQSARGEVMESGITEECASPSGHCFKPVIRYRYAVRGRTYESDRLYVGRQAFSSNRNRVEKLIAKYPANSEVNVYYDPEDPKTACLARKLDNPGFLGKFGLVLIFFGLLFLLGALKV
jgi:hypothetical protein